MNCLLNEFRLAHKSNPNHDGHGLFASGGGSGGGGDDRHQAAVAKLRDMVRQNPKNPLYKLALQSLLDSKKPGGGNSRSSAPQADPVAMALAASIRANVKP